MKMNQIQKRKISEKSMRVFKASIIMALLAAIMLLTFACMSGRDQAKLDSKKVDFVQYTVPEDGAPVVVFETTKGTVKAVLFEEQAPEYCAYFEELVNDGYYDGTFYFFVESEQQSYVFGGAKASDGSDTDDTDKTMLEPEKSTDLWPFRGALCTYGREKGIVNKRYTTGSRIMFLNSVEFDDEMKQEMRELDANQQLVEYFIERGGIPNFSQQFTIFGQVYEGFDVLQRLCETETDEDKRPTEELKIISAKMSTYGENKAADERQAFPESFKSDGAEEASG